MLKIIPLRKENLKSLLAVRNEIHNRSASFKMGIITNKDHKKWFEKMDNLKKNFYFVVIFKKELVGCIYFKRYNKLKNNFLWGFYNKKSVNIDKFGSTLKYSLFEIIFNHYKLKKIYCEVKKEFEWIKQWHIRWGHKQISSNKIKYTLYLDRIRWQKIKKNW